MKKLNHILTILMDSLVAFFIGNTLYLFWHYKTHPGLYAVQSAPWYTGVLLHGAVTVVLLLVCAVGKAIIRYVSKKRDS